MTRVLRVVLAAHVAALGLRLIHLARRLLPVEAAPAPTATPPTARSSLGYEVLVDRPFAPFQPGTITLGVFLRQASHLPEARS